ncbi:MSMEG_0570 family nitrogen starvation response protein [Pseudonocardia xishanensis]|uniref:MSMEG_0570 family nitrogen starvation response protein n=1 Tax=Pseudonocardia xishanensis TaxID=630995 RepID=A0ABP8RX44_9PSEU
MPDILAIYRRPVPEVLFDVRWPDGSTQSFYSPSLIVEDYFRAGRTYPVAEFVDTSRTCMRIADQRVRRKYGFGCAESVATMAGIERAAARFADTDEVTLEAFRR